MQHKNRLALAALSAALALTFSLATFAAPAPAPTPAGKTAPAKTPAKQKRRVAKNNTPTYPDADGFYNAAQTNLGATAHGSGAPINKYWPPVNAISPDDGHNRGTLIGSPMVGGRIDITLAAPVAIKAIETVGLDYHGTEQPKAIDIYVDGKKIKHADLPEAPGKPVRTTLDAKGQTIGIVITDEYPRRALPGNKQGPNYGGWARIRVLTPTDLAPLMKAPTAYNLTFSDNNITPTTGALANGKTEVYGEPRNDTAHPDTIWDQQDINHYKEMLKTSKILRDQLAKLKKNMDTVMSLPIAVPKPEKGPGGQWKHLSDASNGVGKTNNELSLNVANLATVYALTGNEKYGDFAKKILLAYADVYPDYGVGARPGFNHDPSKIFDQRLSDATWLIQVARGYDLIYNLPTMTAKQRAHIVDDLLRPEATFITKNHAVMEAPTNWSAICTASVLITGYAIDDQNLINIATYGLNGTKEKPTGGFYLHFGPRTIADDGMWAEGSTGYQFMAMEALVTDAEVLWHHGIDMYRYRDAALKKLFDSPLKYAYANLFTPAVSDGGGGSIIGYESNLWEFGYERYRDPQYLTILNQIPKTLRAQFQKWPVSILYDLNPAKVVAPAPEWKSINLFSVGMGILRLPDDPAMSNLTLLYGKPHSHGHPDKLTFDLYAMGDRFMPDPGSVWYELPLYRQWYRTTLAHNSLTIDQNDEQNNTADLVVYAPARSFAMERATATGAYPGVTLDRSLFFTPQYVADIYGAFAQIPHTMDLNYHFMGELKPSLDMQTYTPKGPLPNAYDVLLNVKTARTDKPWSATITTYKNKTGRLFAADNTPTQILIGGGYYGLKHPPTVIQRREYSKQTIYANAIDISNDKAPYIKSVTQDGSLDKGYGVLNVSTVKGNDICFVAFRPGTYNADGLDTDAQQAFVLRDGNTVRSLFLAGGTTLKVGNVSIQRSEPGLAYVEKTDTGNYLVGNPSPKEATVTVTMPALAGLEPFTLDAQGKRTGPVGTRTDGLVSTRLFTLAPLQRIELAKPGAPSTYDASQAAAKKIIEDRNAQIAKLKAEAEHRSKSRQAEAAAHPAPKGTHIVIQAEDFSADGNGQVTIVDTKTHEVGKSIMHFDAGGQWVEWNANVPVAAYYNLTICYCTIEPKTVREISVNGIVQEPLAPFTLASTGGFSNGSDNWQLATAIDPSTEKPLLLKLHKGKNTLRLTNTAGAGTNLDYLIITSPDLKPTRLPTKQNPQHKQGTD